MMHYIMIYTTHCPKCKVLEKTLTSKGFQFSTVEDVDTMVKLGITEVPQMVVDCGHLMNFKEAMAWIKENSNG